ncbi:MAG: hypothetical protein IPJ13_05005 [Saprospiraceae bacterium]|nr:hypothetical protein [Saprospiraceae bacterium]
MIRSMLISCIRQADILLKHPYFHLLVKSGLTGDEVGHFELLLFIAVTVSFFWTVGIQNALVSYYPTILEGDQLKTLQTVF